AEAYRKIRNTCRFILGNLFDFDPNRDKVEYSELSELDKWALLKLHKLVRRVSKAYEEYEFHVVFHSIHNFCTIELSNIYFDILKDKLYCSLPDDPERRAAQTVLYELINSLVAVLAPVLAYTSEEIWSYLREENQPESVQLLDFPEPNDEYIDDELENRINRILDVREVVTKGLEEARSRKIIGHSLGAWVTIYADERWLNFLKSTADLDKMFIVSRVALAKEGERPDEALSLEQVPGVWVAVKPAEGSRCERCWIIDLSVGLDDKHPTLCKRCVQAVMQLE
ncbi:MAG: class I tRNA ligase family protein, partial [Syntrophomonadaceae bacterium]|nr:class I tRNA ligase family protein [Syntrophomonadaceae bacterium]